MTLKLKNENNLTSCTNFKHLLFFYNFNGCYKRYKWNAEGFQQVETFQKNSFKLAIISGVAR